MDDSCKYFGSSYQGRYEGTKNLIGMNYKLPIIIEESRAHTGGETHMYLPTVFRVAFKGKFKGLVYKRRVMHLPLLRGQ